MNIDEINKKLDAIELVLKREAKFYAEEIVSKEKILEATRANEAHIGNALSELQHIRKILMQKKREQAINVKTILCPNCGQKFTTRITPHGWSTCRYCGQRYIVKSEVKKI